jgi:hypothetical protein
MGRSARLGEIPHPSRSSSAEYGIRDEGTGRAATASCGSDQKSWWQGWDAGVRPALAPKHLVL